MENERKESLVLYTSYADQVDTLTDENAGKLLKTILHYVRDGNDMGILTGETKMAFAFIRYHLDADAKKWEETRRKRQEAGRNGGNVRAKNLRSESIFLSEGKHCLANVAGNGKVTVNEKITVNECVDSIMDEISFPLDFRQTATAWFTYKKERGDEQTTSTIRSTLIQMKHGIDQFGVEKVSRLIDLSIERSWKGIFYERLQEEQEVHAGEMPDYGSPNDFYI